MAKRQILYPLEIDLERLMLALEKAGAKRIATHRLLGGPDQGEGIMPQFCGVQNQLLSAGRETLSFGKPNRVKCGRAVFEPFFFSF
jgi:hypothetical protein